MNATDESPDSGSRWDDVAAQRSAIEEDLRAGVRDLPREASPTTEGRQRRREARGPSDEVDRSAVAQVLDGLLDIEPQMERRRLALSILAVVVPWRHALRELDSENRDLFRVRAHALLNYLDVAVMPYPDLQEALAAARRELA